MAFCLNNQSELKIGHMICNNKKQVFMGGSPKAKSTDFTPAFFLLQDVYTEIKPTALNSVYTETLGAFSTWKGSRVAFYFDIRK